MLTAENWKRLSCPLYVEELELRWKAEDNSLTVEECERLDYLGRVLSRFFIRFCRDNPPKKVG